MYQPLLLDEVSQRWTNERKPTWVPRHEGGFDSSRYSVEIIPDDTTARGFIETYHYSQCCPAMIHRYGIYTNKQLVGVGVLSSPTNERTLTNVFPHLYPYKESVELGRFVLRSEVPSNGESWFLKRIFQLAYSAGVRGIVSFSDPVARTDIEGNMIFPGHIGEIYRVCNAFYTGRGTKRTLSLLPDGRVLSDRTIQKIRAGEKGHEAAERDLVSRGAPLREEGEDPVHWLVRVYEVLSIRHLRHPGNHRYAWGLTKRIRPSVPVFDAPRHL